MVKIDRVELLKEIQKVGEGWVYPHRIWIDLEGEDLGTTGEVTNRIISALRYETEDVFDVVVGSNGAAVRMREGYIDLYVIVNDEIEAPLPFILDFGEEDG